MLTADRHDVDESKGRQQRGPTDLTEQPALTVYFAALSDLSCTCVWMNSVVLRFIADSHFPVPQYLDLLSSLLLSHCLCLLVIFTRD